MGEIRDRIEAALADGSLTPAQKNRLRSRLRGEAMRDVVPAVPFTITDGELEIVVQAMRWDAPNLALEMRLRARKNGVLVAVDNPFRFINPPMNVPDPAGDLVRSDPEGNMVRFREAPLDALKEIIISAVRAQT